MTSESQIVKRLARALKRDRHWVRRHKRNHRYGVWIVAARLLADGKSPWTFYSAGPYRRSNVRELARINTASAKRIARRAEKKARQPYRRTDRGPMRRRASGKGEVRPSRAWSG